jgi:hypothetical protein
MAIFERGIPTMSFLILAGLIIIFFIVLVSTNNTKIHTIIFLLIIGFYLFVKVCCGPSYFDTKLMQPMAEKISKYIMKNGIPESLKDIPDLPYGLEGCERKMYYLDKASKIVNDEEHANELHVKEICRTKYDIKIEQRIDKMFASSKEIFLQISLKNKKTETGAVLSWVKGIDSHHFAVFQKLKFYSGKTSGICNPMRQ